MPLLTDLLDKLPKSKENRMSATGHALWICWQTDLDPLVPQTLQNYGGMFIVGDRNQSLWFFFSTDVFLALARLSVWARFNELAVSIVHFPAKLLLGVKREISLDIETVLAHQEVLPTGTLDLWVHPKTHEADYNIPGITFEAKNAQQRMAKAQWTTLNVDVRLPYSSGHGWYALLRPLGNPLDKSFQAGWGFMFGELEAVLQQHKFKYLLHENFVIVAIDNLLQLRIWLRDMLVRFATVKQEQHERYWPCVSVVIDRKGLNFNNDLPKKVGLQWDNLMPDFPYMSYRSAYLLGEGFAIQDIRFSDTQTSMDSWCNVAVDEGNVTHRPVPLLMAGQLTSGAGHGCYYCGIRSHEAHQCPTLRMQAPAGDIWWNIANLDLDTINEVFRNIERVLTEKGLDGYAELLAGSTPTSILLQAILDINSANQLRTVQRQWLGRGRDLGKAQEDGFDITKDDSPVWDLLEDVCNSDVQSLPALEKKLHDAVTRNLREPRLRTLQGFIFVNRHDVARAQVSFREGAALSTLPLLQAWNEYLLARLTEMQGRFAEAIDLYDQILRVAPGWRDLEYRKVVCKVKLGFAEQALAPLHKLIQEDPHYFNRCLLDPELGRGQLQILTALYPLWEDAQHIAEEEKVHVARLATQVEDWFGKDHPAGHRLRKDLRDVQRLTEIKNYVAFLLVAKRRPLLEKDINDHVQRGIEELQDRFKHYLAALQEIRDEASWFPYPKALREFSRKFNECAGILNWAFASNFEDAETFQRAARTTSQLDQILRELKKRLKFLRLVRDATLFVLTLGKTFFWMEIVGLLFCFLGVPAVVLYGDKIKLGWLKNLVATQQWEVQKVLLLIITVIAFGVAALRTTIVFEKRRDKLVDEARSQREHLQQVRVERIRRQRKAESEALAREKKREAERQQRMRHLHGSE